MKSADCNICGGPHARAFRVAGLLLRHVCDDCFGSRCVHCGTLCLDERGKLLPKVTMGIYFALYCGECSREKMEVTIAEKFPPAQ